MKKIIVTAALLGALACGRDAQNTQLQEYEQDFESARREHAAEVKKYEASLDSRLRGFYQKGQDVCNLNYSSGIVEPHVECHTDIGNGNVLWTHSDGTGRVISFELYRDHVLQDEAHIVDQNIVIDESVGRRRRQIQRGSLEANDIQTYHDNSTREAINPQNFLGYSVLWPGDSGLVIR